MNESTLFAAYTPADRLLHDLVDVEAIREQEREHVLTTMAAMFPRSDVDALRDRLRKIEREHTNDR